MENLDPERLSWWLFLASATCFVVVGIRSGDVFSIAGALLFFGACAVYLLGVKPS